MYDERLHVPLRWWVQAAMICAALWYAFVVALGPLVAWGLVAAVAAGVLGFFATYGAARVRVADGVLEAGPARIPLAHLRDPEPLDKEQTRLVMGRDADARAYLMTRPWIGRSVRVWVEDPADPTPYWLVSTRRPRRLAAALTSGRAEDLTRVDPDDDAGGR